MGFEPFEVELRNALEPTAEEVARLRATALRTTAVQGWKLRAPALIAALLLVAALLRWVVLDPETASHTESIARFEIRGHGELVVLSDARENRVTVLAAGAATDPRRESGTKIFISTGENHP